MTPDHLAELLRAAGKWCPHRLFTDPDGLAFVLGVTTRTLTSWRAAGKGPAWAKMGRITYDLTDICAWMESNREKTSEVRGSQKKVRETSNIDTERLTR